jgi:hypothetical protein
MRFIDLEKVEPKIRHLLPGLARAQQAVLAETDPTRRAALIKASSSYWTALRPAFEEISFGKCWYTESKNPGTDDDMDHFRPKTSVDGVADHPGYYWLAFDWKNFRLSCHRANRLRVNPEGQGTGGKGDQFPLFDPSTRALTPQHATSLEIPLILDPTDIRDVVLLTFSQNGEVGLSPQFKGQAIPEAKVSASRLALHLDWPAFRDARVVLYNKIVRIVTRGTREAPTDYADLHSANDAFLDATRDLVTAMNPQEDYSAAAKIYVESFKHIWWVRDIVLAVRT